MPADAPHHGSLRNDLGMLVVVLIWGANFAVMKAAIDEIPYFAFAALRFLLATAVFVVLVRWREGSLLVGGEKLRAMLWLGFIGNTAYQLLFMLGLFHTTVANSALILASTPVLVALMGAVSGAEPLTRAVGVGIGLAFLGVAVVLGAAGAQLTSATLLGDLPVLGAAVCWALYTLGVRRHGGGLSPLRVTALTMITGTPGLVLAALPALRHLDWGGISTAAWGGVLYSSLFSLVAAYTLWNTSVQVVGSARTAIYNCFVPLVALAVAWATLGERPGLLQYAGAALIVGGVLVSRLPALRRMPA